MSGSRLSSFRFVLSAGSKLWTSSLCCWLAVSGSDDFFVKDILACGLVVYFHRAGTRSRIGSGSRLLSEVLVAPESGA